MMPYDEPQAPVTPLIDYKSLTPYIAITDRNTPSMNYKSLISMGVVGVLIEAGSQYTQAHIEQAYRNPKLKDQVSGASGSKIPFALYSIVRSRNLIECEKEITNMKNTIRLYQPGLGIWLKIEFGYNKIVNHAILDAYYKQLVTMGHKDRVGLYASSSQLSLIDWDSYKDKFYLLWDNHVSNISEIEKTLDSNFFVLR